MVEETLSKIKLKRSDSKKKSLAIVRTASASKSLTLTRRASQPENSEQKRKREERRNLSIDDVVKQTFRDIKKINREIVHPTKEGVTCSEVYEVFPDLKNITNQ